MLNSLGFVVKKKETRRSLFFLKSSFYNVQKSIPTLILPAEGLGPLSVTIPFGAVIWYVTSSSQSPDLKLNTRPIAFEGTSIEKEPDDPVLIA
jgi:hypothetical protein